MAVNSHQGNKARPSMDEGRVGYIRGPDPIANSPVLLLQQSGTHQLVLAIPVLL